MRARVEPAALPVQITRKILPWEQLPFYSTAELLSGVCHWVSIPKVQRGERGVKGQLQKTTLERWALVKDKVSLDLGTMPQDLVAAKHGFNHRTLKKLLEVGV